MTQLELCNLALGQIREPDITDINGSTPAAKNCKKYFDVARRYILRDTNWQYITRPLELTEDETPTPDVLQWLYAYEYPSDCLKLLFITGEFSFVDDDGNPIYPPNYVDYSYIIPDYQVSYEVARKTEGGGGRYILTNQKEAYAFYLEDVDDVTLFDDSLVTAFYHYLASLIAVPIVGIELGKVIRDDQLILYATARSSAIANNQNEKNKPKVRQPKMIDARW
jgi:hypothetical protein